ncbi:TonB-dependent receptor [Flavobacterium sp. ABG]|uniref:TonB-dependent receptor n=1 Tax=Flavobacterium sp. ABG TaxID=1423322 RepID=UPI000B25674B|nr:TonB-dependent receptor [Flavobacterium sp. ABG]
MNYFTTLNKYIPTLLFTAVFFLLSLHTQAQQSQSGTIKGQVMTEDGKKVLYGTVSLNGKYSVKLDKDGWYVFDKLTSKTNTITASIMGLASQTKTVTLNTGEEIILDFTLTADAESLNEVFIVGNKYKITSKKNSEYVSRLPIKNLENSQVYSVVDKELIKEQMALTVEESFRNVPGAAPAKTGAGMPSFFSRGFQTSENFRNGMATYLRTGVDLAAVERVETYKGPSSTLFGAQMTSFGGIVNYITKKPYDHFGGEIGYTMGSWDLSRVTLDINTPVKDAEGLFVRLNVARQTENTFQDQGNSTSLLIAPSITYQVSDRLKFTLNADFQSVQGIAPGGWMVSPTLGVNSFNHLNLDYRISLNDNSLVSKQGSTNVLLEAEYKISDQWTSQSRYAYGGGNYDDLYIFDFIWQNKSSVDRLLRTFTDEKSIRKNFQQNFIGDFKIGNFRNRLVVGFDYLSSFRSTRYDGLGYGGKVFEPANLDDLGATPVIRIEDVESVLAKRNTGQNQTKESTYSVYASDVFNVTDQLLVMASLRVDRYIGDGTTNTKSRTTVGNYNQTAFSPKFGLVYQILEDKLSVFGNYMNGFKNIGTKEQPDKTISVFKPQEAAQLEGGVKLDFSDKINATVSYYQIDVTNSLRNEVTPQGTFVIQDGTQKSKGVEIEVIGRPFSGFNYVASYGYNDNEFTKSAANVAGKRAAGTPKNVVNLWASYTIVKGKAQGLGMGIGNSYVSDAFIDNTNTFTLSSYNLLDATLFYNRPKYRIGIKANNILDRQYWVSDGYYARPQKPSNFMINFTYKF